MNTRLDALKKEANTHVGEARRIAEKAQAESRPLTAEEREAFDAAMAKGRNLAEQITAARNDEKVLGEAKALADSLGLTVGAADLDAQMRVDSPLARPAGKSLGQRVVEAEAFKSLMGQFGGGRVPEKARVESAPIGFKSLFTGTDGTSGGAFVVPEQTGLVEMLGRRDLTIRDVISVRRTGSDSVEYVRQTAHTNAAAPVPEATTAAGPTANTTTGALELPAGSGVKPEGSWSFERASTTVKTIAEWVPATKRALADVAQLEDMINDELQADLAEEEEDQVLNGDGTGENLTGILNTSGTQVQAFSTDIFATVRKAITKVRTVGRTAPNAIGMNPADVETVDLAREGGTTGAYFGAGPFSMGPRTLWGVPILESEAIPAGTALVGDFRKAVLWDRQDATVTISDSHADFFTRNLVAILAEERIAFAVTRPTAFVEAALA